MWVKEDLDNPYFREGLHGKILKLMNILMHIIL